MNATPIIVAIDSHTVAQAQQLIQQLDPKLCRVKIGKGLFTLAGPMLVEYAQRQGFEVFLDLKFHDIPNTVAHAIRSAASLGVWMVNVHALGGVRMLEAAQQALASSTHRPLLTAVTILTSLTEQELPAIGIMNSVQTQVMQLATLAQQCGLDGVVCSSQEAHQIKSQLNPPFITVCPGIRPLQSAADDQRRIMTPALAKTAGADYLVIGRAITQSANPLLELQTICSTL